MAQRVSVPADVVALKLLDRVDYEDAFAAETSASRTAEQWARLCLEVDPPEMLRMAKLVLTPFGLRAGRSESSGIGGLRILRNDPENVVLGFKVKIGTPRIVFSAQSGRVVMSTLLRFNGFAGLVAWAVLGSLHRVTARSLVDRAAKIAARESTGSSRMR
jgi:Protein of unknown function (DUF2867)